MNNKNTYLKSQAKKAVKKAIQSKKSIRINNRKKKSNFLYQR